MDYRFEVDIPTTPSSILQMYVAQECTSLKNSLVGWYPTERRLDARQRGDLDLTANDYLG